MSFLGSFITLMAAGLWHWLVIAFVIGYALGSIPFGVILTRLGGAGDVRAIGSGNIGATNVLRTGRKGLALATFAADALKGTAAVLLAGYWFGQAPAAIAGIGAFVGHLYPVWLKFRGGKGVATYAGVIGGLAWPGVIAFAITWLAVAAATRLSSLAAIVAVAVTPLALLALGFPEIAIVATVLSLLIVWTHRGNIRRLLKGEEPRIGAKDQPAG